MRATGTVRHEPYGSHTAMARIGTHCSASIRDVGGSIEVTSTSGWERKSSARRVGTRSSYPWDQRRSRSRFWPST